MANLMPLSAYRTVAGLFVYSNGSQSASKDGGTLCGATDDLSMYSVRRAAYALGNFNTAALESVRYLDG